MNAEAVPTPIAQATSLSKVQTLDLIPSSPSSTVGSSSTRRSALRSSFRRSNGASNNSGRSGNGNNGMRRHFESTPSLLTMSSSSWGSPLTTGSLKSMRRTPSAISLEKHDVFVFERLNMLLDEEDKQQGGEDKGVEEGDEGMMARCQSMPAMSMSANRRRNSQQLRTQRARERARQISEDGVMADREICPGRSSISDNEDLSVDDGYFPGYDTADESDSEEEDGFGANISHCRSSLSLNSGGGSKGALPLMARIHDEVIDDHVKKGKLMRRNSSTPSFGSSPSTSSMRRNNVSFVAIPEDREHLHDDEDDIVDQEDEYCHYGNNNEELLCEPQLGRQRSDSVWSITEGYEEADEDDELGDSARFIGEEDSPFSLFGSLPPIQIRTRGASEGEQH